MSDLALSRWRSASWSIIDEQAHDPAMNVAIDDVLLQEVMAGRRGPTLRFWAWASPAIIIGRYQSLKNEVDLPAAQELGIQVVRRMSGGGAMLVRPDGGITYSLIMPTPLLEGLSIRDSYGFCDAWVVAALRELGADVRYVPLNDIASPLGKVGGAAQARRPGGVLHHTMIAYRFDGGEMMRVLRIGREKLSDKGIASAAKRVHPLHEQIAPARRAVVDHLLDSFRREFMTQHDELRPDELHKARDLVESRYGTAAWTAELE
jgi:lipoate-protein ligase A